jgi:hypothetical protein
MKYSKTPTQFMNKMKIKEKNKLLNNNSLVIKIQLLDMMMGKEK